VSPDLFSATESHWCLRLVSVSFCFINGRLVWSGDTSRVLQRTRNMPGLGHSRRGRSLGLISL
jgi:hypothetical protein